MTASERPQVVIRNCETYDVPAIRAIIRDGLQQMQLQPRGRTLLKPNLFPAGSCSNMPTRAPSSLKGFYWPCAMQTKGQCPN